MTKPVKISGPDHPIAVVPYAGRVVVRAGGKVIADTHAALELREASYAPAYYIPRRDADMTLLTPSDHATYCPYKGDCRYFSLAPGDNAVWSYEQPYDAVADIRDHLAFYPNRVDQIELLPD